MHERKQESEVEITPQIWAVGGGKGGVGKSTVSTLLAFWLARMGNKTILMDVDLGGANIHTFMGIKSPPRTLNDFIAKRYDSLEDISIETEVENLRIICGACDILTLANPHVAQKTKIIQNLSKLNAKYVVLDLGAGTSFNVLDFFLVVHRKIIVLTPQPISIQNAYAFVRNAVFRRLSRLSSQQPYLQALIRTAMDTNNELRVKTIRDLYQVIEDARGKNVMNDLEHEIGKIQPQVITNMITNPKDKNAGRVIQIVSEKYLMIHPTNLGGVVYDKRLHNVITEMIPLTTLVKSSDAFASVYDLVMKLI
ncbi:MAG: P-loop NTPase [Deltaproteobacteria bacterium]|nr:P-loop NTPase [Deltaproteobacteria bacterium]